MSQQNATHDMPIAKCGVEDQCLIDLIESGGSVPHKVAGNRQAEMGPCAARIILDRVLIDGDGE